ncbi:MAG: hypothetical protein Q8M31_00585 [Beijerinckiaceae bacterium]|nr:hypothetical protein [Beijerinckiaceae bacterium]
MIGDRRGAAAFEMAIIYGFLMFSMFLPLADVAMAGFKFISAHQALRDMAQRIQYSPPSDITTAAGISTWQDSLPASVSGYTITPTVYCGSPGTLAPCTAADALPTVPKRYKLTTNFTAPAMTPGLVFCSTGCTVSYSIPFQ